jgi:hypothetical protein
VTRNEKGHPDLVHCAAMNSNGICKRCSHRLQDHMHIYVDYKSVTYKQNEDVNKDLIKNATNIELQGEAIRMRQRAIEEFKIEHLQIQEVAIAFGFFLKSHAIIPYNNATCGRGIPRRSKH